MQDTRFWRPEKELKCVVQGDDFTILDGQEGLDLFWEEISTTLQSKQKGRVVADLCTQMEKK